MSGTGTKNEDVVDRHPKVEVLGVSIEWIRARPRGVRVSRVSVGGLLRSE